MRDESIRRFALGADAPPELLLGVGSMNHWGAWIVKEDVVHTHLSPPLALVCDAFTTQYLRPVMEQMGRSPEQIEQTVIWFDVEHLISRPSRGDDAKSAHESGVISDEALRDAYGYTEDDAPEASKMDEARKVALGMIQSNSALMVDPGLAVLVEQLTALLNGSPIPEVEKEPVPEALGGPPEDEEPPAEEEPEDEEPPAREGPPRRISPPPDDIAASGSRRDRVLVPS